MHGGKISLRLNFHQFLPVVQGIKKYIFKRLSIGKILPVNFQLYVSKNCLVIQVCPINGQEKFHAMQNFLGFKICCYTERTTQKIRKEIFVLHEIFAKLLVHFH